MGFNASRLNSVLTQVEERIMSSNPKSDHHDGAPNSFIIQLDSKESSLLCINDLKLLPLSRNISYSPMIGLIDKESSS